jgi:LPS sulfotransferase NodH
MAASGRGRDRLGRGDVTEGIQDDLRGYAICTQPRSGSNIFCQYLSSTRRLGYPLEYFNGSGRRALGMPDYSDDPLEQIAFIRTGAATDNGVYALKLFAHQHDLISARHRWTELLPNLKFVYLERRDLIGQAVSWARAVQTSQFRSTQPVRGVAAYDGALILERLQAIVRERARWDMYFARTGISPLRTAYEDVIADPAREVARVAALVGLAEPVRIDPSAIDLQIQRDAASEEWRRRFHAEHGDPDRVDTI